MPRAMPLAGTALTPEASVESVELASSDCVCRVAVRPGTRLSLGHQSSPDRPSIAENWPALARLRQLLRGDWMP
jgi:hypothetical protein